MRLPILRKEFRYRAGGLLALPVLLVAGWWGVAQTARTQEAANYESILAPAFAVPVTMICAAVGLACGLWQVLGETGPGSWAFLRHRPVSNTRLLFGKLGAALLIYLLVTGVPLVGVIVWAKNPGHFFGPWLWQMAIPSVVDLLCGTVYILAGMLIGMRGARWFGSRLLPVGLAIICSAITWVPWLWVALAAIAVGWLILLPATWSAMASRGRESRQGWAGRTVTAVTLMPAMVAIPILSGALTVELLSPQLTPTGATSYYVQRGAEFYETRSHDGISEYRRVADEKGALLKDAPYAIDKLPQMSVRLVWDWEAAGYGSSFWVRHYRFASSYLFEQSSQYRGGAWSYGEVSHERWCYLRNQNYFVGYSRRLVGEEQLMEFIGYIGSNGFTETLASAVPFQRADDMAWWSKRADLLVESGRVTIVNWAQRQCRAVFTTPLGERAVNAGELLPAGEASKTLWAVATDKAIYLLDEHQKVLLRQPHIGAAYPQVSVGASADLKTFGLLYFRHDSAFPDSPMVFVRVSADGTVLTRTEVPGVSQPLLKSSTLDTVAKGLYLPPGLNVLVMILGEQNSRQLPTSPWLELPPIAGCALVSVTLTFWLLRRGGERRAWTIFWLITVLLMGISGVLLMLATRQWPLRVRCGQCGRKSVATAFACQHCGKAFAIPNPGAIGIRDDLGVMALDESRG